jgi:hypothetical protein
MLAMPLAAAVAEPSSLPRSFPNALGTLTITTTSGRVVVHLTGAASDVLATSAASGATDTNNNGREEVAVSFK